MRNFACHDLLIHKSIKMNIVFTGVDEDAGGVLLDELLVFDDI